MKGMDFDKKSFTPFIGTNKSDDLSKRSDWPHIRPDEEIKKGENDNAVEKGNQSENI